MRPFKRPGGVRLFSVLFVDDSGDLLTRIRTLLENSGEIRVDPAHSLKQAIDKLKNRSYDVILSCDQAADVNGIEFVPEMSGIEFIRYLRSAGNGTPVILLSRKPGNKLALKEVSVATEIAFPPAGDLRPQLAEIVTLIRQSVLRKKAEREIKARNDQLTAILSATPLGIFQLRNSLIQWVNPRIASLLGYGEAELVGKNLSTLFPAPEEYAQFCRESQLRQNSREFARAECNLLRKDHTLLPCLVEAQVLDPRDIAQGGTFIVTDITERKALSEALRKSEAKYRDLLANTQSIVIRMDLSGTITFCNQYALTFFDYAGEDLIGKNVAGTIVSPKTRPAAISPWLQMIWASMPKGMR